MANAASSAKREIESFILNRKCWFGLCRYEFVARVVGLFEVKSYAFGNKEGACLLIYLATTLDRLDLLPT